MGAMAECGGMVRLGVTTSVRGSGDTFPDVVVGGMSLPPRDPHRVGPPADERLPEEVPEVTISLEQPRGVGRLVVEAG